MSSSAVLLLTLAVTIPAMAQTTNEELRARARSVFERVPLIDGHNDVPWELRQRNHLGLESIDLADTASLENPMHTDIPRLREGGVGAQFWSVYVPTNISGAEAVLTVLEQIDVVHRMTDRYSESFEMAYTADDIERIHRSGKIASLIGMEGGHSIGNSLGVLRQLYRAGARYMTVTHSSNTGWADSATDDPKSNGLSAFGGEVIREMARLGMLIDMSHLSAKTMHDILDITPSPIIFSHSSARALNGHPRNVPDDVLKRLPENGGVVMVTFVPSFLNEEARLHDGLLRAEEERLKTIWTGDPDKAKEELDTWKANNPTPKATLTDAADHIDHILAIAGIDHLGIGSDFDGITSTPTGLEDVSKFPDLFAELLRRGYSEEDLEKVAGRNVLRVMRQVETVASTLQKQRPPSTATYEE